MDSATSQALTSPAFPSHGEFGSIAPPDLLIDLQRRRFSGTLRADRSGVVKVLYFNQGDFACASSNAEEDRLGNLLVRHGRLSADQLAHAKQRQGEKASIGNTLVELGFISSAELLWGARRQVEEIITDLLGWREGTYQIRGAQLSKEIVNLQLPSRALIVRSVQQMTDREVVVERLGTMEAVLSRVEPFEEAARSFEFGFPVEELIQAVDGRRTVREVCESIDQEDFAVCKALYTLLCFGLLRRGRPASAREVVFVEGEQQSGEPLPRVPDPSRWNWRKAAAPAQASPSPRASTPPPPSEASETPAPQEEESATPEPSSETPQDEGVSIFIEDSEAAVPPGLDGGSEEGVEEVAPGSEVGEEPAAPAAPRTRFKLPPLAWKGLIALGLAALGGTVLYLTYFRPTVDPEEERLLSALLEEAETESPAPKVEARPSAPSPPPPAPAAPLENAPRPTMLSEDPNFRSAMKLVEQRRIGEAAESFRRALDAQEPDRYTIQLLLACQDSTIEKSFEQAQDRTLYFVSTDYRGRSCYRLFDGLYSSAAEAGAELERLPSIFREGGNRPAVVPLPRP